MYAFLTDGLTTEGRAAIDKALEGVSGDTASQAKRERAALSAIFNLPQGGASV